MGNAPEQRLWQRRLVLTLLLAPALLWLFALIVLPHIDLALLSFRERSAPRHYQPSLTQYRTFFTEPLYWHTVSYTHLDVYKRQSPDH